MRKGPLSGSRFSPSQSLRGRGNGVALAAEGTEGVMDGDAHATRQGQHGCAGPSLG